MRTFRCRVQDFSHQWESQEALSFIGQDPSGSFGLQAHHETFVTCLRPGLARVHVAEKGWVYIAQPGSVVVFRANVFCLTTSQFILSWERDQLIAHMEEAWQSAHTDVQHTKVSYVQLEQALTKKLWEMNRHGEAYGAT
ncbi:MAG: hypothetical protein PHI97_01360 [Desulfobulbus sp.]|nr:hypothetical protein [Desulfobulbus sp.]